MSAASGDKSLVVVYTDGATSNNGGKSAKGGLGVWFGENDPRNLSEEFSDNPTNQRCELMAIRRAMDQVDQCKALLVKTDSKYSIGCLTEWCHNWEKNGWLNSKREPVKNRILIESILDTMRKKPYPIVFEYVKGHASGIGEDVVGNRMADLLAVRGRGENEVKRRKDLGPPLSRLDEISVWIDHATGARMPTRGTPQSAGWDLYAASNCTIEPGAHAVVETGVKVIIPEGCYGRIAPRSGLAFRSQIDVLAGVVDRDYRDTLKVILQNLGSAPFRVEHGSRIAQLVVEKICEWPLREVGSISERSTQRGLGGFGSTGV